MENRQLANPRDQAMHAALADAGRLGEMAADEFTASYQGPALAEYLRLLATYVSELGGQLEDEHGAIAVSFEGRRILVRVGPISGHR